MGEGKGEGKSPFPPPGAWGMGWGWGNEMGTWALYLQVGSPVPLSPILN